MKGISDETQRFVRSHFRSMLQLEALLVLAREPERWWSPEAVNRELRSSIETTAEQLRRLTEMGLAETRTAPQPGLKYRAQDPERQKIVDELIALHGVRYHALIDLLYAPSRAREFADAFRIKKNKDEGDG